MGYEVVCDDGEIERIEGADSYQQEGPLTTFFDSGGRGALTSWSVKVASIRTDRILRIHATSATPATFRVA